MPSNHSFWRIGFIALSALAPCLAGIGRVAASPQEQPGVGGGKPGGVSRELSPDEQLVKDRLQELLYPTSMQFLDDDRVQLVFDFSDHSPDQMNIFKPPVSSRINSTFRWTVRYEYPAGLRIANSGMALLSCWFKDDVEAEFRYRQGTNSTKNQVVAVVFCNKKKESLGSNFGNQCQMFRSLKRVSKPTGTYQEMIRRSYATVKLVVRDETFEAHRDGRKKTSMPYSRKKFASGKIGFLWSGNSAGMISRLAITGRIDFEATVKELKKSRKGRRR